jgi:transcription initiation factor TFIIA large subunit
MQAQYGTAASASVSAMQRGSRLALPGQQQSKPQGLQLPAQSPPPSQQQYLRQQQQQLQQQQAQPRIKVESNSPHLTQTSFPQQTAQPNYSQTDGADDGLAQWQEMLAARRAMHAAHGQQADRLMRDQILQHSAELQSGLMMPLDELPSNKRLKRTAASHTHPSTSSGSSIPQLDGIAGEEDEKIKDEDEDADADAINSDLDDSSDDGRGPLGEDDDENVDSIL